MSSCVFTGWFVSTVIWSSHHLRSQLALKLFVSAGDMIFTSSCVFTGLFVSKSRRSKTDCDQGNQSDPLIMGPGDLMMLMSLVVEGDMSSESQVTRTPSQAAWRSQRRTASSELR
jgi:hypothetical protein